LSTSFCSSLSVLPVLLRRRPRSATPSCSMCRPRRPLQRGLDPPFALLRQRPHWEHVVSGKEGPSTSLTLTRTTHQRLSHLLWAMNRKTTLKTQHWLNHPKMRMGGREGSSSTGWPRPASQRHRRTPPRSPSLPSHAPQAALHFHSARCSPRAICIILCHLFLYSGMLSKIVFESGGKKGEDDLIWARCAFGMLRPNFYFPIFCLLKIMKQTLPTCAFDSLLLFVFTDSHTTFAFTLRIHSPSEQTFHILTLSFNSLSKFIFTLKLAPKQRWHSK